MCGATQDGWVMVESSGKMWSTGEGNGKTSQYSCLENPKNSVKRQEDMTLRDELPRSVGTWYATGEEWRNDSRKNEGRRRRGQQRMRLVGWYHRLYGHEFEQALGVGDGQGGLVCCSPWGRRVGHNWATELNWSTLPIYYLPLKLSILCLSMSLLSIYLSSISLSIVV